MAITPEARVIEQETQVNFCDMEQTPTAAAFSGTRQPSMRPLRHFFHIAQEYGIRLPTKRLGPAAAVHHLRLRLAEAMAQKATDRLP